MMWICAHSLCNKYFVSFCKDRENLNKFVFTMSIITIAYLAIENMHILTTYIAEISIYTAVIAKIAI